MQIVKSFFQIDRRVNNTAGRIAVVGELPPVALSYSKDIVTYINEHLPETSLKVFFASNTVSEVRADQSFIDLICQASTAVYQLMTNVEASQSSSDFVSLLTSELVGSRISVNAYGPLATDGAVSSPTFIKFYISTISGDDVACEATVWYSGRAFADTYDESTVIVIPPIETIDQLVTSPDTFPINGNNFSYGALIERANLAAEGYPFTTQKLNTFTWVSDTTGEEFKTTWVTLHYGISKLSNDAIQEAITGYIELNSVFDRSTWADRFPELYYDTEIVVVPLWKHIAVPNELADTGVFSSDIGVKEILATLKQGVRGAGYTDEYIDENSSFFSTTYRGVIAGYVGGSFNSGDRKHIRDFYPDFLTAVSTSADFSRMTDSTRGFAVKLFEMIAFAETTTPYTSIPTGYSRVSRSGRVYLAGRYEDLQILVLLKSSLLSLNTPTYIAEVN